MVFIGEKDYERLVKYCLLCLPKEACGLLGGIQDRQGKWVKRVYFLTNMDNSAEHFSMDPKEQFAAIKDMRANGWKLLGNFHSHPASPPVLSEEDIRLAYDVSISYLVLSLADPGNPVLNAFQVDRERNVLEEAWKKYVLY
ncbi:M67 family peptidase [bacterium D16-51]|nr:M67 family peptidase [bacterium D16-59]RKI61578.1 M67 family peptidase [bacterium D16-51]